MSSLRNWSSLASTCSSEQAILSTGWHSHVPGLSELSASGDMLSLSLRWRNDCLWGWLSPSLTLCTSSSPILLLLYPCNQLLAPRWTILNNYNLTLVGPPLTAHSSARPLPMCICVWSQCESQWARQGQDNLQEAVPPCCFEPSSVQAWYQVPLPCKLSDQPYHHLLITFLLLLLRAVCLLPPPPILPIRSPTVQHWPCLNAPIRLQSRGWSQITMLPRPLWSIQYNCHSFSTRFSPSLDFPFGNLLYVAWLITYGCHN